MNKALATAGTAIQTSAAAIKGLQNMTKEMKAVDQQVSEGVATAEVNKEQADSMKAKIDQAKMDKASANTDSLSQDNNDTTSQVSSQSNSSNTGAQVKNSASNSKSGGLKGFVKGAIKFGKDNKDTLSAAFKAGKEVYSGIKNLSDGGASATTQSTQTTQAAKNYSSNPSGVSGDSVATQAQWDELAKRKAKLGLY